MGDVWTWLLFLFIIMGVIAMLIFQLLCLADLELDNINAYDSAYRINKVVLPEFIAQGALSFLFLVTGHWVMALLSIPYLYYNARLYTRREHLIDVTEIFNMLNQEKKKRLFKLGYLIVLACMSLFWMIYSVFEDDDHFV